jgi:hypothetical protein
MSYQDHLMTCSYCNGNSTHNPQKLTAQIKAGSSYRRERKLSELASITIGVSYPRISYVGVRKTNSNTRTKTKAASDMASRAERQFKLKELGKMVRGL